MLKVDPEGFDELDRRLLQHHHRVLRRRPGRRRIAGRGAERGARHARGRDRALPDPAGLPDAHRARPHGHAEGLPAPRPEAAKPARADLFDGAIGRSERLKRRVQLADTRVLGRYRRWWRGLPRAVPGVPRARAHRMDARAGVRPGTACGSEHDLVFAVRAMQHRLPHAGAAGRRAGGDRRRCANAAAPALVFAQAIRRDGERAARRARCASRRCERRRFRPRAIPQPLYDALNALEHERGVPPHEHPHRP